MGEADGGLFGVTVVTRAFADQVAVVDLQDAAGRDAYYALIARLDAELDAAVGNDYIALYQPDEQSYISADLYSIRFMEFLPEISQTNSQKQQQP